MKGAGSSPLFLPCTNGNATKPFAQIAKEVPVSLLILYRRFCAVAGRPAVANDHAVFASSCGLNVEVAQPQHRRRRAIASSSAGARWAALANDHAMLARACGSSGRSRAAVAPPRRRSRRAAPSAGALWPAVANAHAVLASSCGLKSRRPRRTAASATAAKSAPVYKFKSKGGLVSSSTDNRVTRAF